MYVATTLNITLLVMVLACHETADLNKSATQLFFHPITFYRGLDGIII